MNIQELEQKTRIWIEKYADTRRAEVLLSLISFLEASILPLPPSAFMLGMVALGSRRRWVYLATLTTVTSVIGGLFGYVIGAALYNTLGVWIVEQYHLADEIAYLGGLFAKQAFLANFVGAFTPVPYKAFTIASGFFSINIFMFTTASLLGRGLRFFIVAYLAKVYGEHITRSVFKYVAFATLAVTIAIMTIVVIASM